MSERLDRFERPSRYIGGEVGAVVKDESEVKLHVALAFPDVYEIGMSHLGLKILYGLINRRPGFWAERVMAPWTDREADLRRRGQRLAGLESGRPLSEFDLIGFSLQYELSYTNVLNMLDLAGLPLLAAERENRTPLIVGGGPCSFNPEPLADFFDFFYLGEAEAGLVELLEAVAEWKAAGASKPELLAGLAGRPGVYVPSLFEPVYGPRGRLIEIRPRCPGYTRVSRAIAPDLDRAFFPESQIVPFTRPIHDRLALEIARGCTRGCRFCQAGFIYRPVRERRPETILKLAEKALAATGLNEVSFLSLSAGDYSCLPQLMTAFMDAHSPRRVALSLPSLRVKSLTGEMMAQIKRVRKTGFTLAPEAGTQRLRDVINKDLTEDDLVSTAREAFGLGWRLIKLYFMIGLPTETEDDVKAIARLARRVRAGTKGQVGVSFAAYVPKAHTPFQWEPMLDPERIHGRMDLLRGLLRAPGLKPKWNQAESSLIEGVLARGDRRLGRVLRLVQARGGRFDSWNEKLEANLWLEALAEAGLPPDEYLRGRDPGEVLPWSHLSAGPEPDYLWSERERAYRGLTTPDCRFGTCDGCGVCDFEEIKPLILNPIKDAPTARPASPPEGLVCRVRVNFIKDGPARFLSHLETVDVFTRALRRAGLDCRMSRGFHPHPSLRFISPLPVGLASRDEYLEMEMIGPPDAARVKELLTRHLPTGFGVRAVHQGPENSPKLRAKGARYRIEAPEDVFDSAALEALAGLEGIRVTRNGKKGPRQVDLKPLLGDLRVLTPRAVDITLYSGEKGSVRPRPAAGVIFNLDLETLAEMKVVKTKTLLEGPLP